MAFDGKGLLVLLPKVYVLNALLVVLVFLMISCVVSYSFQTLKEIKSLHYFFFESNV